MNWMKSSVRENYNCRLDSFYIQNNLMYTICTEDILGWCKNKCFWLRITCTGNEATLEGVKIIESTEDLELDSETSEECKEKCSSRIGECGSWSFDSSEGICYIHTVDSCCGQFGKREDVSG